MEKISAITAMAVLAIALPIPRAATRIQNGGSRFVVAKTGNTARYRVREQLAGHDFPNDAVGETQQINGAISFDMKGAIVPNDSKFVVSVAVLKSDQSRRDRYVSTRVLETDNFPTVQFVPTALRGLSPAALKATNGTATFEMLGDLTVHGTTKPVVWKVSARREGDRVNGSASTRFTFTDFELRQPRLSFLLSVGDTVALEYDFALERDTPRQR